MENNNKKNPSSLLAEIGPDGLVRESPVIAYTEMKIEEEQNQLKKYIQENYSKIRDVERELQNLTLEVKLTAGPKKAALEHLRKKIEVSTEKIRLAKIKEEEARKVGSRLLVAFLMWEEASKAVKDEEATKNKLCDDLNQLENSVQGTQSSTNTPDVPSFPHTTESAYKLAVNAENQGHPPILNGQNQQPSADGGGKKKVFNPGRGKGTGFLSKGRGAPGSGWTGAGFDVDGRT
ncbi:hypothetical protein IFM89_027365 [Coptis chinensis]|uniref:RAB6-interacting golgin n=1 Tax=Coptis chinensis TaxID=261450 RepID=A0A835IF18_9MAGN|nr:hypothetical protein IFM89_027365 [Coptis chinensis]